MAKKKTDQISAIQDFYPDDIAVCYGCGRNNPKGHHVRTVWDGKEGVFRFKPKPYHTAFPGVTYGGLIASLIDCHSIGTAVAAAYDIEGRAPGTEPEITFVTGNLNVTYLKPTPIEAVLELRSKIKEWQGRKAIVICSLFANGEECAKAEVLAVRVASRRNFRDKKDDHAL
ncbi:MAG: PaaI family thioesterase [Desulfobacteraceae bacterium]|nr:MAG: PaaI family thioesterase [Desulfobacteraceae bacterium]